LCTQDALYVQFMTDESDNLLAYREDTASWVAAICRDIRRALPGTSRGLVILKAYNLKSLVFEDIDRMATKGKWRDEIAKRVGNNFNYQVYADVILPITFDGHWLMMICNYQDRVVTIVKFRNEVTPKTLDLFARVGTEIWKEGCQGGLKCVANNYIEESKASQQWTTKHIACCKG
jgi:hypothetical protein